MFEGMSGESCQVVSPDNVKEVSRYLESPAGPGSQQQVSNDPAEASSDSGDSLFITQKPVPKAVRSQRRRHSSCKSHPTYPSELSENEEDSSSSADSEVEEEKRGENEPKLPRLGFHAVRERKWRKGTTQPLRQNRILCNHIMAGFFTCVQDFRPGSKTGGVQSSLPTVDTEGEDICPLTEEDEDERSSDGDMKVVERKCFVAKSKAKKPQHRYIRQKGDKQVVQQTGRRASRVGSISGVSSDTESTDDGDSSRKVAQTEAPKRRLTRGSKEIILQQNPGETCDDSDASFSTTCEPQRSLVESPQLDVGASGVCHTDDPSLHGQSADKHGTTGSNDLMQSPLQLINGHNSDEVCSETCAGERQNIGQEQGTQFGSSGRLAATSVDVEIIKAVEIQSLCDGRGASPGPQASNELELNENSSSHDDNIHEDQDADERQISNLKEKKKQRKKGRHEDESDDVRTEEVSVVTAGSNVVSDTREKTMRRSGEHKEDEQLSTGTVTELLNDDAEKRRKKKKRNKEKRLINTEEHEEQEASGVTIDPPPMSTGQLQEPGYSLDNTAAAQDTSDASCVKRKKHKRRFHDSADVGEDVNTSDEAVQKKKKKKCLSEGIDESDTPEAAADKTQETTEDKDELVIKKKKKKKKTSDHLSPVVQDSESESTLTKQSSSPLNSDIKHADSSHNGSTSDGAARQTPVIPSSDPPGNQAVNDLKVKKKKKKKTSEIDSVAQSDDSVSLVERKKKRTSSFLVADAEELNSLTHQNDVSLSQPGAALSAAKPADFQSESAEIAVTESHDGMKKKKKRKKMSATQESTEKYQEEGLEESNVTCQGASAETAEAQPKRKKKKRGDESPLVTPVGRLESAADEVDLPADEMVVLKKKKKKKKLKDHPCPVVQDSESERSTLTKQSSSPLNPNSKHADSSHNGSTSDGAARPTPVIPLSDPPRNQAVNDLKERKKEKKNKNEQSTDDVLLEKDLPGKVTQLEPCRNKRKGERDVPSFISSSPMSSKTESHLKTSSSDNIKKKKPKKVKRTLHNTEEDFLTDC